MNGLIYKIYNKNIDSSLTYIGSTTCTIKYRWNMHKSSYKYYKLGLRSKVMVYEIFDEYGIDNCVMEVLQEVQVTTRKELHKYERMWYELIPNCNNNRPYRYTQEYKDYQKQWRDQHNEYMSNWLKEHPNYHQEYRQKKYTTYRCECGSNIKLIGKSRRPIEIHCKSQKHTLYKKK